MLNSHDILETINMIDNENLDVRTITMGISLLDCIDSDADRPAIKSTIKSAAMHRTLVKTGEDISKEYGIPIIHKRISVTPSPWWRAPTPARTRCALPMLWTRPPALLASNFIGGYSALVHKGFGPGDYALIESIPRH